MAIWAIKGYDEFYGGLHGMINYEIFEGTEKEADARGLDMSLMITMLLQMLLKMM